MVGAGVVVVGMGIYVILEKDRQVACPYGECNIAPSATPTPIEAKPLKIAIMADIHNDLVSLKTALEKTKSRGVEMVFLAGDLTINGNESELIKVKNVLDESGVKYEVVPGNHDLYKGVGVFNDVFGPDYNFLDVGTGLDLSERRIKVILINNGSWRGLGDTQFEWIKEQVQDCEVRLCLAVMHMPLDHNYSEHVMGEDNEKVTAEAEELNKLLVENGVKYAVTGHLHYATMYTIDELTTMIAGAVSKDRNTQTPRYTEIIIRGDELVREVVVL